MSDDDDEIVEAGIYTTPLEEQEPEEYEPVPAILHDAGVIIFDPIQFQYDFNCHCAQLADGVLFVLDRDSLQWVDVQKPRPKLSTVK